MKYPKIILVRNTYPLFDGEIGSYTEYKFHHKEYEGCYCYIHWWINGEGKWRCFKIYFEKGNSLYRAYLDYLNGIIDKWEMYKFIEWGK